MKPILSIMLSSVLLSTTAFAECVPARTEAPWPSDYVEHGKYHRLHPSGDYLLVSNVEGMGRSNVVILDLKDRNPDGTPKVIATPLSKEAYPDSNWDLISSPTGYSGPPMDYYSFKDILKNKAALVASGQEDKPQPNIPSLYRDEVHGEYYQSVAEVPGSTPTDKKICTLLYSGSKEKCYNFKLDAEGKKVEVAGKSNPVVTSELNLCNRSQPMSGPVLSKDGSFVATADSNGTTIFPIQRNSDGSSTCGQALHLPGVGSKVTFSYPSSSPKSVTFHTCGPYKDMSERCGVKRHNLETNVSSWVTSTTEISRSYPNFTADGRIVYVDIKTNKIITIDPNQIDEDGKVKEDKSACIQMGGKQKSSPSAPAQPKARSV